MEDFAVDDEVETRFRRSVVRLRSHEPLRADNLPALAIVAVRFLHLFVGDQELDYVRDAVEVDVLSWGEELPKGGHERAHVVLVAEVSLDGRALEPTEMQGDPRLKRGTRDCPPTPSFLEIGRAS